MNIGGIRMKTGDQTKVGHTDAHARIQKVLSEWPNFDNFLLLLVLVDEWRDDPNTIKSGQ